MSDDRIPVRCSRNARSGGKERMRYFKTSGFEYRNECSALEGEGKSWVAHTPMSYSGVQSTCAAYCAGEDTACMWLSQFSPSAPGQMRTRYSAPSALPAACHAGVKPKRSQLAITCQTLCASAFSSWRKHDLPRVDFSKMKLKDVTVGDEKRKDSRSLV